MQNKPKETNKSKQTAKKRKKNRHCWWAAPVISLSVVVLVVAGLFISQQMEIYRHYRTMRDTVENPTYYAGIYLDGISLENATLEQAIAVANEAIAKVRMGFFPGDLEYLRAGGRVSNAAYLGAKILSLHPLIEILDGKLMSTKKYRGKMAQVIAKLADEYTDSRNLDREKDLYLIYGAGLDESVKREVERIVTEKGFKSYSWVQTGCVIAAHSGPGAFGIVGFEK